MFAPKFGGICDGFFIQLLIFLKIYIKSDELSAKVDGIATKVRSNSVGGAVGRLNGDQAELLDVATGNPEEEQGLCATTSWWL